MFTSGYNDPPLTGTTGTTNYNTTALTSYS